MANQNTIPWKFDLGQQVQNTITGFQGTVINRIENLDAPNSYTIEGKFNPQTSRTPMYIYQETQLEAVNQGATSGAVEGTQITRERVKENA